MPWNDPVNAPRDPDALIEKAHWAWASRDKRSRWTPRNEADHQPSRPTRRAGIDWRDGRPLDRWVYVWPESGRGYVIGLTFRSEGVREEGYYGAGNWEGPGDYQPPYLIERERFPLYEVRATLRARSVLCPIWAVDIDQSGADWMSYELRALVGAVKDADV